MKKFLIVTFLLLTNIQAEFVRDNTLEVVNDTTACLVWQDDSASEVVKRTWQNAIKYCQDLNLAGYDDWRLPNQNELYSIGDKNRYNPSINSAFENASFNNYWSSTTVTSYTNNAWSIDFSYGHDDWDVKGGIYHVRCVRDGE